MRDGEREIVDAARALGEPPERLLRFARGNLKAQGVTDSDFAAALRTLFVRGPTLAVCTELESRVRAFDRRRTREAV